MTMNAATEAPDFRGTMVITDNWYEIRSSSDNRLLAVGTWLPPVCEGIEVSRVETDAARALMAVLAARSHGSQLVGTIIIGGE